MPNRRIRCIVSAPWDMSVVHGAVSENQRSGEERSGMRRSEVGSRLRTAQLGDPAAWLDHLDVRCCDIRKRSE